MPADVSVILIVKNGEFHIPECLESLKNFAGEIIIVDDESTDRTCEIAARYTDKIFTRRMELEGKQRNFGVARAKHEWVMMIDTDERMTSELAAEMTAIIRRNDPDTSAYWVPRKNYLGDVWLRHGGFYPSPHLKLYRKAHLRWNEASYDVVHPGVTLDSGCGKSHTQNHLIHYNFKNLEDFIQKMNRQSTLEAIKWHLDGRAIGMGRGFWRTFDRFFRRYVRYQGFRDGYEGFISAYLMSFYQFAAYSKYREIKKNGTYLKEYGITASPK